MAQPILNDLSPAYAQDVSPVSKGLEMPPPGPLGKLLPSHTLGCLLKQVEIYSRELWPQWPIEKLDGVNTTCRRYCAGHGLYNDEVKILLWAALADYKQTVYNNNILSIHFYKTYVPTIQVNTLMALYFKYRGLHDQALEHINIVFRLANTQM